MINIKTFDSNLIKIDKTLYKNIDIYYIGYITIKNIGDFENIYSVNPLYFIIGEAGGYIEERHGNRYLAFTSADKNREVLITYTELWYEIKYLLKTINGDKADEYRKDFMIIRFESDNSFPLGRILKLHMLTVIVRSAAEENSNYYPQIFLDGCLYGL